MGGGGGKKKERTVAARKDNISIKLFMYYQKI
jgi:hypothetical protein